MLIEKLPKLFQSNQLILKLAEFIEGKKVLFSSIVYLNQGKKHIIKKTSQTPYFQKDWQCYSFFRCYANTLITTGSILRTQHDIFKSYFACGDQQIEEMYTNFKPNGKQNVYVMTNSMPKEEVMNHFNPELYSVLMENKAKEAMTEDTQLTQVLEGLIESKNEPVLIECGPLVMSRYFQSIRNGSSKNLIDGVYIAFYEGLLSQQSIGNEFEFEEHLFEEVWQSEKFNVQWKGKPIGKIFFKVYKGK